MPRDGSGGYTPPAGTAATANTTIESSKYNDFLDDNAAAHSAAIVADGQKPFSSNQPMGNNKFTGLAAGTANGDSVRYEQSPAGILTTRGDTLRRGASAPERVAIGTVGKIWISDGTDPSWGGIGADIKSDGTNLIATQPVITKNNIDYTVLTTDRNKVIQVVSSSTTRVMTMPTAAGAGADWSVTIMNVAQSAYTTTVAASTGNFYGVGYSNAATITLSPGESITLESNGTAFYVTHFSWAKSVATTSTAGIVEKATQAETNAGTANKYPSAAEIKASRFVSTGTVISTTSAISFAHGLGVSPIDAGFYLQCTATDKSYASGDRLHSDGIDNTGGGTIGSLSTDATNIGIRLSAAFPIRAYDKGGTTLSALDTAKWDIYLWAKAV